MNTLEEARPCSAQELLLLAEADGMPTVESSALFQKTIRRLRRLESRYPLALFDKRGFAIHLTPFARRLDAASRAYLQGVEDAFGHAYDLVGDRTLVMAATTPVSNLAIDRFVHRTGRRIEIRNHPPGEAVAAFEGYHVDAVHAWWVAGSDHVLDRPARVTVEHTVSIGVRVPCGHKIAGSSEVSLRNLAGEPWVSEIAPDGVPVVSHVFRAAGVPEPERLLAAHSPSLVRSAAARGEALSVAMVSEAHEGHHPGALTVVLPTSERPVGTLALMSDPHRVPAGIARDFIDAHARGRGFEPSRPLPEAVADAVPAADLDAGGHPGRNVHEAFDPEMIGVLEAVARSGSVNRAASQLALSQPALTRKIQRMEQRLGEVLLVRTRRGTTLTAPAQEVLRRVEYARTRFLTVLTDRSLPGTGPLPHETT